MNSSTEAPTQDPSQTVTTCHGTFSISKFANLFRRYTPNELAELAADIKRVGKITTPVLRCRRTQEVDDGVNRILACNIAGIAPEIVDHDLSDEERLDEVIRRNRLRRHLSLPELAALSVEVSKIEKTLAEERQHKGRPRAGEVPPSSAEDIKGEAAERAGKRVGIGKGTVRAATQIAEKAPDVLDAMATSRRFGIVITPAS